MKPFPPIDQFTLHGPQEEFTVVDGQNVITSDQIIGKDIYDELDQAKSNFKINVDGYTPVATIPEGLVNKWIREGFDFWSAPANEIKRKLALEDMSVFNVSGDTRFDH
jgi:hypothetical protein